MEDQVTTRVGGREGAPSSRDRLVLGTILALALSLRLFKLNAGLWYDEVDTLVSFTRPSFSWLLSHYPSLNHHIFFSLQAKACIALFGESPFALRLPAALLGTGSIAVLWFLAREVSSRAVAHLSALLLTVAYHHVWFSQNGRGYTGLLFFGLLSVLFYVRGMAAESAASSRKNAAALGVSAALMLYTHLSAAFLLSAMGLVHLCDAARRRWRHVPGDDERRRLAWSFWGLTSGPALAAVLYLPIVPQLLASFSRTSASSTAGGVKAAAISHWNSPIWMLKEVASSFSGLGPLVLVAAASVLLVALGGMLQMVKRGRGTVAVLFLVHVPMTVALLKLGSMRIWPRYFFADIGFIVLFLVEGAAWLGTLCDRLATRLLGKRLPGGQHASVAVGALGVLAAAAMLPRNYRFPKQDLAGARDFVQEHRSHGARVFTLGLAALPFSQYYAPSWEKLDTLPELLALERSIPELWVVYAFPAVTKRRYPAVMTRLDYSFETAARLPGTMGDGDVLVLKSKYARASVGIEPVRDGLSVLVTRGLIGGNTGVYVQGDDVLLVDSNAEPMQQKVEQALRTVTSHAPRWVVNTHWHLDHAGGNAAFARQGAAIIAHANAARRIAEDLTRREEPLEHRLPTEFVTDRRILQVSGREVRILHLPAAHTDGDLVVHFVDANVIQTGDLFVQGSFPYISAGSGGSIGGYISAQQKILQLCDASTRLIPGHGEVTGVDGLKATLSMLEIARDRVAELKTRGQSLEQVLLADPLKDMQGTWGKGWITSTKMAEFVYTTLGAEQPARAERANSAGE